MNRLWLSSRKYTIIIWETKKNAENQFREQQVENVRNQSENQNSEERKLKW